MNGYLKHDTDVVFTVLSRVGLALRVRGFLTTIKLPLADGSEGPFMTLCLGGSVLVRVQRRSANVVELVFGLVGERTIPARRIEEEVNGYSREAIAAIVEDLANDLLWALDKRIEAKPAPRLKWRKGEGSTDWGRYWTPEKDDGTYRAWFLPDELIGDDIPNLADAQALCEAHLAKRLYG